MTDEERQKMNDVVHNDHSERLISLERRITKLEGRMSAMDTQYAVINTKLSAILWGLGVTATAVIGMLVKILFGA